MDLRVERTRKSIHNAFIQLRSKKPLEKISVKELSELAVINKATFYAHYRDIYDLSDKLEDELIASIIKTIPNPENIISDSAIEKTLSEFLEENDVRRLIYQYLQDCWNPKLENSILTSLPVYAKVIKEFNDVKDIIVCKNGVFCLDDLQLKKFSSKYHSTFRLEAPYNPDANASTYDKFLKDISCNDAVLVDTFNELLGYVLCSSIQAEKLIIMNGFGANGKSTYLNLLTAFVGVDNVSNISINEINGKAFSRHFIADKRLNLIYEGETDMVMSGLMRGAVKQIVTGDPTSAEIKMGKNYSFIPKLKLIMATNTFPQIDKIPDHATARRLLILPFNNHFSADKNK